jgi:tetratricopeptide (TPR) repeat protein
MSATDAEAVEAATIPVAPVPSHTSKERSTSASSSANDAQRHGFRWRIALPAVVLIAAVIAAALFWRSHKSAKLTEKDTIVLADFDNKTGDAVFDDTLKQGLSVQLEQSPFFSIISDQQVQQTLQMMGHKPDARLTPEIARELCQRVDGTGVLNGSISQIGEQFLLTLKAINCSDGKTLTSTEVQASDKSHVLDALGRAASELRSKLGESVSMVQKFNTPLEQATTRSLEALRAYTLGRKALEDKDDAAAAVPLFQRAIQLDPNFAMAYASLGTSYSNLGEPTLGAENTRKAYELRERTNEREKFYIESHYYDNVMGDLEKARRNYELWAQTYPRDGVPPSNLAAVYSNLGQYEKALEEAREAFRLYPGSGLGYGDLVYSYLYLNHLEEAQATAQEAQAKHLDSPVLRSLQYQLAFLQNDEAGMARQVAWSAGRLGVEDVLLALEADTAAYSGRVVKAREFSRQAFASAERAEEKETAAGYEASAALREALFGNGAQAQQLVASALALSTGRDVQYATALALALNGNAVRAEALADDLGKRFPEDTIVRFNYLPTLHAQLALSRNDASKAIEFLQVAVPYELGQPSVSGVLTSFYPVFVRGQAYLATHQGSEAAAEFQKILDHRGIVLNEPIGALAHLQIGRAYAMQGDAAKAKAGYQDFLTLWKDADSDIPVLIAAKAELARLK